MQRKEEQSYEYALATIESMNKVLSEKVVEMNQSIKELRLEVSNINEMFLKIVNFNTYTDRQEKIAERFATKEQLKPFIWFASSVGGVVLIVLATAVVNFLLTGGLKR